MSILADQIATVIQMNKGKYIFFKYFSPPDCKRKLTPSMIAERAKVIAKRPLEDVKAFVGAGIDEKAMPWLSKKGNWCITMLDMNRQNIKTRKYEFRCFRLDGIKPETLTVNNGARGLEPVFPQVQIPVEVAAH